MSDQIERLTDEEIRNLKIEVGCLYNPDPDPGEGDYWYVRLGWQMFERYEDGKAWAEALKRRVMAFLDEMQEARERLEEREADMHVRIRQEYDSTVADAWRAEVARKDQRIAELEAALANPGRTQFCEICEAREKQLAEMRRELEVATSICGRWPATAFDPRPILDRYDIPTEQPNEDVDQCSD